MQLSSVVRSFGNLYRYCLLLILLASMALPGGCSSPQRGETADIVILPGNYAAAFDAARERLIDLGFELERVDAHLGIITTQPKASAGLASPWDQVQSTPMQEVEDMLNRQQRRAIVTFRLVDEPEHRPPSPQTLPGPLPADLRLATEPMTARVEVVLERVRRPGWRLDPSALRFSGRSLDPSFRTTGMWPTYSVPFSQDPHLAARVAVHIRAAAAGEQ